MSSAVDASAIGAEPREPPVPVVWRLPPRGWALGASALLLLCASAWRALGWLWNTWIDRPEYSHGPLLPLIAAFLVWQRKDRLEQMPFDGSYWGPVVVLAGGLLLLLGTIGAAYTLQQYAVVVVAAGLLLAWVGRPVMLLLAMPLLVLLLMVPQPDFVLNNLSAKLQLLSSSLGVAVIRSAGISVFLEGNVIDLGGYRLQVVDACAGLRYLFPLMTLGLLIAYFYRAPMWKRLFVFAASIPVTVAMNSLRIGTIGIMVDRWGSALAEGFVHDFQGWSVFMISAVLLVVLAAVLNLFGRGRRPWRDAFGMDYPLPTPRTARLERRAVPRAFLVALGVLVLIGVAEAVLPNRAQLTPAHPPLSAFPTTLRGWYGRVSRLPGDVLETLQLDDYALLDYADGAGGVVSLYVSYYATQRDRRVVHSPAVCLPGSGWRVESGEVATPMGSARRVNRMVIANGEDRALVYYWFDQRGRDLTSEWSVKWYLFWDAVTMRRSDGAMIRLLTPLHRGESIESAQKRLDAFVREADGPIRTYVPR
jgi:exosortase D (VPLPA-CTERM-specific)